MQRTCSLPHDQGEKLLPLLRDYRSMLNGMIQDIWDAIEWKVVPKRRTGDPASSTPMKQNRLLPLLPVDKNFKRMIRDKHRENWGYATHWVDSAERTAFSIVLSWRKNYNHGERSRNRPQVTRLFALVKQSLCKLEGASLRVTMKPREFVWIDLSRRYFRLPGQLSRFGVGEPVITPERIHLPLYREDVKPKGVPRLVAWDSNFDSFDGYSPESGWKKIDTGALFSVHDNSSTKLGSIKRRFGHSVKGRRLLKKYRHREFNRAKKHQIEIARVLRNSSDRIVVEALVKRKMFRGRAFNYRLCKTDWRGIAALAGERVEEVSPRYTTKNCSRCGWTNQDLNGAKVFACRRCGLRVDRQLNACIGIYERAEGVPYDKEWWDRVVLPSLVGGYFQTGAESRAADELVRSLYETVKPQAEYGYDRYADAYLPKQTLAETRVRAVVQS
jgi:putative transposase